jgi:Na+/serine symporter
MKISLKSALLLAVAGTIAGCGSSGEQSSGMTPPVGADGFTQSVQGVLATSSDTAMPIAIDGIAAVGSDTAPPVGL